tara:strand:+ start:110 stop:574 length:465 start_codon:yes stop_codon:yes gene_type:complete
MTLKKGIFLSIFLILLQSCSGGSIGNFLESSFEDLEQISQNDDSQKSLNIKKDDSKENAEINDKNYEKTKKLKKPKVVLENKIVTNSEKIEKQMIDKNKNFLKKEKVELQSYKIILILKDVDPKYPTEDLSTILRNSDVNFEIEKIERIFDSKK